MLVLGFISLLLLAKPVLGSQSILLLGDSLSASLGMQQKDGWVVLLNNKFKQKNIDLNIVNASISGETTSGGLSRLPQILAENKFDYLLVELGGNDGLRGFKPSLIENNLLQIIALAKQHQTKVLLMEIQIPPNYGPRYTKTFTNIYPRVAEQTGVTLLPFFIEHIAVDSNLMQADGIHPTKEAQPLIAEFMLNLLTEKLLKTPL